MESSVSKAFDQHNTIESIATASSIPIPQIRSTQGCWTCRLRKKKCDEIKPKCKRCTSVGVECCFGPRPDWMKDKAVGREELKRIKVIVGASASRKRAAFRERSRLNTQASWVESPQTPQGSGSKPEVISPDAIPPDAIPPDVTTSDVITPEDVSPDVVEDLPSKGQSLNSSTALKAPKSLGGNEANLMMHYLDNVFYIQFRFFKPSIAAGGRGWLLALLNRTKPLYHAALSLSAFHHQSLVTEKQADQAQIDYLHELERHHNLTLEELRLFIQAHNEHKSSEDAFGGNVQILACMVQLISFELFNGGTGEWQVHLGAAARLVLELHNISSTTQTRASLQQYGGLLHTSEIGNVNLAALEFFASAIVWFDILACISTQSRPHLADYHHLLLLSSESMEECFNINKVQLQRIMGCQNWAMVIIAEIAHLSPISIRDSVDMQQIARAAKDVQRRLDDENFQTFAELIALQQEYSGPPPHFLVDVYNRYITLLVTRVFACAAVIYLQTVVTENPTVFHMQDPLRDVMAAMSLVPDPRMFRGMVWPLCIAGCMASSPEDQEVFRKAARGAVQDARTFGNSIKALEILEGSWKMQKREGKLIDCASSLQRLGICVLLV